LILRGFAPPHHYFGILFILLAIIGVVIQASTNRGTSKSAR